MASQAKKPKKKKIKWHFDRAWKEFSIFIRVRDGGKCFTCGIIKPWKEMQAGHFHHGWLDFHTKNVNCQDPRCNKWLRGNLAEYALRLQVRYGSDILIELDDAKREQRKGLEKNGKKYTREVLDLIYYHYKAKNEEAPCL